MADFSTKRINEVYPSLLHLDNGSGTASSLSGSVTNREIRDGGNFKTTLNVTDDQLTLGKSNEDAGTPNSVKLAVRQSDGNSGAIFCGSVNVWNNSATEGGQIMLKDGNTSNYTGEQSSFCMDNYVSPGGDRSMRIWHSDDASTPTHILNLQAKDGDAFVGVGTINPSANLHVMGNVQVNDTILTEYDNQIYCDATSGLDSNPGTLAQPFKTLDRATKAICPYSYNFINLFGSINPSAQEIYNWVSYVLTGNVTVRVVKDDGQFLSGGDADIDLYRENTIIRQTLTSDYDGSVNTSSQWHVYNNLHLSISGMTFEISFPGTQPGHNKTPVSFRNAVSKLGVGSWTNGTHNTKIKFMNANTNVDGVTENLAFTSLLVSDQNGANSLLCLRTRFEDDFTPTGPHQVAGIISGGQVYIYTTDCAVKSTSTNLQVTNATNSNGFHALYDMNAPTSY